MSKRLYQTILGDWLVATTVLLIISLTDGNVLIHEQNTILHITGRRATTDLLMNSLTDRANPYCKALSVFIPNIIYSLPFL